MSAYTDLTSRFTYGLALVFGDHSKLANNDGFLKDNGWQDGTVGIFFQAAAPTGWTKLTTVNDQALRVVSGFGGGVGGTQLVSAGLGLAHTHSIAAVGTHTHTTPNHRHTLDSSPVTLLQLAPLAGDENYIGYSAVSASVDQNTQLRQMFPTGTTNATLAKGRTDLTGGGVNMGSAGAHDHGGATNANADITLAYVDVLFCSKDTSAGYGDLTSTFVHNTREVFDYFEQLAQNDNYNYQRRTPAGTVSLFGSATAPTGWTKQATQNDKALRVVSATGAGSGGVTGLSGGVALAHVHTITAASHSHTMPDHQHFLEKNGDGNFSALGDYVENPGNVTMRTRDANPTTFRNVLTGYTDTYSAADPTTSDSHDHGGTGSAGTNVTLAYIDVIQASKDSSGEPAAYTDMRGFFLDQDLLAYQDLQKMANSDAYLNFHTMPSGGVMFFFQSSAPLNWTKLTAQDDKALRIVSGTSGGSAGGTQPVSAGLSLAHTHSISSYSHAHAIPNHQHAMKNSSTIAQDRNQVAWVVNPGDAQLRYATSGGSTTFDAVKGQTLSDGGGGATGSDAGHDHGGATGSGGSTVVLAYADVIMCSKN